MSIGVVFPGQGSQRIGMAKDFYDQYEPARQIFAQASDALGISVENLCFEENETLDLTEYTQPAILTAEIAIYESLFEEYGLRAEYVAGHSLGEYTALVASGVLNFRDAVQIVRKRGALMQTACPPGAGAMAALIHENIEHTGYKKILFENNAEIANINSREQVVISGYCQAVDKAILALQAGIPGIKCVPLNVSAPFHSSIMKKIEAGFSSFLKSFLDDFEVSKSKGVLSNYTGDFYKEEDIQSNLVRQLSAPVLWIKNMNRMNSVAQKIYEIGPNRPLTKFFANLGIEVFPIISLRAARKLFAL